MYINRVKRVRFLVFCWIQLFLGGIHGLFAIIGFGNMIGDFDEVRSFWGVFVVWAILAVILVYLGIKNLIVANNCRAFNEAFRSDEDGFVSMEEIAFRLGISKEKALKRLRLLIRKGCLVNIVVDFMGGNPVVVLQDNHTQAFSSSGERKNTMEFLVLRCPNCGNSCPAKRGIVSQCEFGGGYIKG